MGINDAVRQLRRSPRVATTLWLVFAFVVWNVVFDRMLVLAGRRYVFAAATAARQGSAYLRIEEWMRPAVAYGARIATITALTIAVVGMIAVAVAARLDRRRR